MNCKNKKTIDPELDKERHPPNNHILPIINETKEENDVYDKNIKENENTVSSYPPPSTNNEFINQLTLECMMNRTHYKTYLSKKNPNKLKEHRQFQEKIAKYRCQIENIFNDLLCESIIKIHGTNTLYNNDIQKSFDYFIENSLQYIEHNEKIESEDFYKKRENNEYE
jgi:hypothetical protein